MTVEAPPLGSRFILHDVSWQGYETLLREVGDRHVFITYDRGTLEFMSPSPKHERVSSLITRLIWAYTEELRIPIATFGMTTWRREDLARGLEADNCFYIANEALVRTRDDLDLERDPPPDLAIEVEVSRSALDRLSIYKALKVGELWCWADEKLSIQLLGKDEYEPADRSRNLPGLPPEIVEQFVAMRVKLDELNWVLKFREWARTSAAGA
jgi:Uma2 family endonuclease